MSIVKTTGLVVLRLFGFSRRKATTRLGKYARNSERAIGIAGLIYLALLCFPQVLFAYNVNAKGVTIYSRAPLPSETTTRIEEALALVGQSELAVPGRTERIFVCNNPWLYRLLYPVPRDEIAVSFPVTDNIFVRAADLVHDVALGNASIHNRRGFSSTVAHEITHGLIRHRLGVIATMFLRSWVNEGYCDYVARESSFPAGEGLQRLREGHEDPSASFRYFVYREMVRHVIEDQHYSFDEIVKRAGDEEAIKAETIAVLREDAQK
jgi:hypothetical protein